MSQRTSSTLLYIFRYCKEGITFGLAQMATESLSPSTPSEMGQKELLEITSLENYGARRKVSYQTSTETSSMTPNQL
jgi:hypothetical protein